MNNSNPLIPQGSLLEQNQGRARFKVAVFCGIALHILFVGGLLMVGCKKDQGEQPPAEQSTTGFPAEQDTNFLANVVDTNAPSTTVAGNEPHLTQPPTYIPPTEVQQPPVNPPGGGAATEYVVTKGDTFATIAKKMGVSTRAIQNANPTVVPTKLKIGQKLQIPPPSSSVAPTVSGGTSTHAAPTGGGNTYTVKSGDSLTKIATSHGVSVKALRAANNLRTDRIKVGDKLKIPSSGSTSAPAPEVSAPVDTAVAPPVSSSVPSLPPPTPGR